MLFHSQAFLLLFLPPALAVFYLLPGRARLWWLLAASMAFYGYWDIRFLPLLAGSIAANWGLVRMWGAKAADERGASALIAAGVALNLGILAVFKYADFIAGSAAYAGGWSHDPWGIVLPLGISFFTFQQLSYLIDLRRGQAPLYGLRDYALYVAFFPQLIAGPIVRHNELVPQFARDPWRDGTAERLSRGALLLVLGLGKKVFVADRLARVADPLFQAAHGGLTFAEAWIAAAAFGLQIYFDFSAYSDMAIGLALMFGFVLPENFRSPYRAASLRAFWQRWHMTLSRFLRDYLYIPLGGSRHGTARTLAALMATMLLGGLWHGAAWTFVLWGALHGLGLAAVHLWRQTGLRLPALAGWALTLVFVTAAWVPFRAQSLGDAGGMLAAMGGLGGFDIAVRDLDKPWILPVAAALALLAPRAYDLALERLEARPWIAAAAGVLAVLVLLQIGAGQNQEFIYFQF
ncbi:MAG: MBOAT family protein [Alphaproteobacteria bacterium]